MSNKIVRVGNTLVFGWLDSIGINMVNSLDLTTGQLGKPFTLGRTAQPDNHCGPALAVTSDGYVHAILGTHHRPFHYRRSVKPGDASAWTDAYAFGPDASYPSLTVGPDDTLHLASRAFLPRGVACKMAYLHKRKGESWTEAIDVAITPTRHDYTHYGNTLLCDANGTLHLTFHLYQQMPQPVSEGQYYLQSKDDGKTWTRSDGSHVALPATEHSAECVADRPGYDVRGQGLAIAPDGRVMIATTSQVRLWTSLFRHDAPGVWTEIDLRPTIARLYPGYASLQDASITFDHTGRLYVLLDVKPGDAPWGDAATEVVLLTSDDCGETFNIMPISEPDPSVPQWLSSLEKQISPLPLQGPPALMYTRGVKGETCTPSQITQVELVTLTN